jgi:hypothetical protein
LYGRDSRLQPKNLEEPHSPAVLPT